MQTIKTASALNRLGDRLSHRPSELTLASELERLADLQRRIWDLPGGVGRNGWWVEEYDVQLKRGTVKMARWRYYEGSIRRSVSIGKSDSSEVKAARVAYRKRILLDEIDLHRRHVQDAQRRLAEEAAIGSGKIEAAIAELTQSESSQPETPSVSNHQEVAA